MEIAILGLGASGDQKSSLVNSMESSKLKLVIVVVTAKKLPTKKYALAIQIMLKLLN